MLIAKLLFKDQERWSIIERGAVFSLEGDFRDPRKGMLLQSGMEGLKLLAPVDRTSKIILLLGNWAGKENRDGPAFILKPSSAVINPGDDIVYPKMAIRVHAEPELAIVIGSVCREVSSTQARDHILGYTIANDTTMFEMSAKTSPLPFLIGKCVDTFGSFGPWIVTDINGDQINISAFHDGELYLQVNTSEMAWSTSEVVSWVSTFMTLYPGDIICCGAPLQYSLKQLIPGSHIRIVLEGIGTLESRVINYDQ